jgi:penicillin-insensitive murein endopeptidase
MRYAFALPLGLAAVLCAGAALAQAVSNVTGQPAAAAPAQATTAPSQTPAAHPHAPVATAAPAKQLFGAVTAPAALEARSVGFYARGCLAGGHALPIDGTAWQVMRLSRNRNWGHPALVRLLERFASDAQKLDGWPGLLVGDMSQPRGGPMLTGHASHQVGLDADIWFTPMPSRRLTDKEREDISATSMLGPDNLSVDPAIWSTRQVRLIKRAASYPEVERIFVHPAIKKALCEGASSVGADRSWLSKVRPYWGHYYHFHVRIVCPKDSPNCKGQPMPSTDDGCGKEVSDWLAMLARPPKPEKPEPPKPPVTLAQLPAECKLVLDAPSSKTANDVGKATPAPAHKQ